jgi:antitoxin CcdA
MRMARNRLREESQGFNRKATNISLNPEHVAEAKELGINLSQACEQGLVEALSKARAEKWREENREAMEEWNAWVKVNGLPLEKYRLF